METRQLSQGEQQVSHVTAQHVQKVPVQGIGGWLILPFIGLFYMFYKAISMMLQEISQVKIAWPLATQIDSDFYVSGFASAFYLLQMGYGLLIALLLWTFIAAIKWKKSAKLLFIISMIIYLVVIIGARFVFPNYFGLEINYSNLITAVNSGFYCVIWIPYFLVSSRVKNTFIR
ncbi:DUF2569 family protein [Providencia sp.]|uniref:DUF2569 family protein n=1 Tax=Providencia sp. TaxID=589 RepID=UPI003F9D535C